MNIIFDKILGRIRQSGDSGNGSTMQPVRLATAAALPANTRTGNTLTADLNGALGNIDGVAAVVGDRILVKNEGTGANNGWYEIDSIGSGGSKWSMTRTTDADTSAEIVSGVVTAVEEGTDNADKIFMLTTNNPITINVTSLTFTATGGSVLSVFGRTGAVVSANGDYNASQVTNAVPYTGATADVNIGTYTFIGHSLKSDASDGVLIESANGTDVGIFGAGNTANALFYGGVNVTGAVTAASVNNTYSTTVTVSSAELLDLFNTPKTLIAAPSAGTYISVRSFDMLYDYGGTAYANTGNNLQVRYTNGAGYQLTPNIFANGFLNATVDKIYQVPLLGSVFQEAATSIVAQPLVLWYATSNLTTGNGVLRIKITYEIITTGF